MTTGTWDARSLQEQAKGQFEVGIMDFPIPAADDPVYGAYDSFSLKFSYVIVSGQ